MQELTGKVRESVHLSVLERNRLLVVAQQESPERVRLSIEVGGEFDPVATASGRLLLAYAADGVREQALSVSPTWRAMNNRARTALAETLAEIRKTGTSFAESETIEGVRDVAVLVGDPASGVIAALAITRLVRRGQRGDEATLVAAMRGAARTITESLGWEGAAA
ncbi:MAG TPA: IclR family transcriptional regulator C-terminal domain-containing protein, partial [Acidobacteriota bacterium]|nr:IclR family transcriptional regulator C-terminal domain-containing protein [Acidobacteriota bacterium]